MKTSNRDDIIEEIKSLDSNISKLIHPDYPSLGIFSSKYYSSLISEVFYDGRKTNTPYALLYGDFNRLNLINKTFGVEVGDEALFNSLSLIKDVLPENAIISRIGGDEFSIILPGLTKVEAEEYTEKINCVLDENSDSICNLTIALGASDSSFGNLEQITEECESQVRQYKYSNTMFPEHPDEASKLEIPSDVSLEEIEEWKKLNELIDSAMHDHMSDIRPSPAFLFDRKILKEEILRLSKLFEELLDFDKFTQFNLPSYPCYSMHGNSVDIDYETAKDVFEINTSDITNSLDDSTPEELYALLSALADIQETLVIDRRLNFLSSNYFKSIFADRLCSSDNKYIGVILSASGLRLSNTAYGHDFTDMRLEKTSDKVSKTFNKMFPKCNRDFYTTDSPVFLIDKNAGNYLALFEKDSFTDDLDVDSIAEHINSGYDLYDPYSTFHVSVVQSELDTSTPEALFESLDDLSLKCDDVKSEFKQASLNSITNKIAFRNSVSYLIEYYKNNIPNYDSNSRKKVFSKNVFFSLMTKELEHNKSYHKSYPQEETIEFTNDSIDSALENLGLDVIDNEER